MSPHLQTPKKPKDPPTEPVGKPKPPTGPVGTLETMSLHELTVDPSIMARARLDDEIVTDYADAMDEGVLFPPVTAFRDVEGRLWLTDGFHRQAAEQQRKGNLNRTIAVNVLAGTRRDAILWAVMANAANPARLTNEDKRVAVTHLLEDKEWRDWSDHKIAEACGVSPPFVGTMRKLTGNGSQSGKRRYTTKHGSQAVMDTSKIGTGGGKGKRKKTPATLPGTITLGPLGAVRVEAAKAVTLVADDALAKAHPKLFTSGVTYVIVPVLVEGDGVVSNANGDGAAPTAGQAEPVERTGYVCECGRIYEDGEDPPPARECASDKCGAWFLGEKCKNCGRKRSRVVVDHVCEKCTSKIAGPSSYWECACGSTHAAREDALACCRKAKQLSPQCEPRSPSSRSAPPPA